MQDFPNYIKLEGEQTFNILEEIKELNFKKKKNTFAQCQSIFTSSASLLKKVTEGQLDAVKCAKSLKSQGVISEDVVLMLYEIYLQKCKEYCGGEIIGANKNNELYKGLLSLMIIGLKENVPYIIKSVPERNIDGKW